MAKMKKLFLTGCVLLAASVSGCGVVQATIQTKTNPKDGAAMVYVPAGTFTMGSTDSDSQARSDEKPAHQVDLDGYWIYKNDVTVGEYKNFCAATNTKMPYLAAGFSADNQPIVNVSWNDAEAYCTWAGTTLPSEAQWEKAARGTDGRIYPWGNEFDKSKCWTEESGATHTAPVGSFPDGASPYGCLDMTGNVWQWCSDRYGEDYYANSLFSNPTGPDNGGDRVLRGGSWRRQSNRSRSAARLSGGQLCLGNSTGFRCIVPEG